MAFPYIYIVIHHHKGHSCRVGRDVRTRIPRLVNEYHVCCTSSAQMERLHGVCAGGWLNLHVVHGFWIIHITLDVCVHTQTFIKLPIPTLLP